MKVTAEMKKMERYAEREKIVMKPWRKQYAESWNEISKKSESGENNEEEGINGKKISK